MYIVEKILNQQLNVEKNARLIGCAQPDILFFSGLKITEKSNIRAHGHSPFKDVIYYFSANVQYFIEKGIIYITSAGGVMLDTMLNFSETEMDLTLVEFNAAVIDVNGSGAAVGDNLGDHIATQDLDLATNSLVGDGGAVGVSITSTGDMSTGNAVTLGGNSGSGGELIFFSSTVRIKRTAASGLDFHTDGGAANLSILSNANLGVDNTSPATKLDVNGAITQSELSSDPADPAEGAFVTWMSDGTGSGDDGDIMMKIQAGGVVKTITIIDFSAA